MKYNDGRATNHEVAEAERRGVSPFRQHLPSVAALIVQCSHGESSVVAHARHRHGLVSVAREEEYRQAPGKWRADVLSVRVERRSLDERDAADGEEETGAVARIRRARDEEKAGAHDDIPAPLRAVKWPDRWGAGTCRSPAECRVMTGLRSDCRRFISRSSRGNEESRRFVSDDTLPGATQ